MVNIWQRIFENLFGRLNGPLHLRFIIQPVMAIVFAVLDGIKDAREGKPAYFWALVVNADHRRELLKEGWKHVGKIFILAVVLDVVYQLKVFHKIYPGEMLIVSVFLAIIPYILLRGPVNRIISKRRRYKK